MKKVVIIGDIHGRDIWKRIVEQERDAKAFVFLGDYFDSKERISGKKQLENFLEITAFKKQAPKRVIMLFGNHDYHYMTAWSNQVYSGFQPGKAKQIERVLTENMHLIQMAWSADDLLCTHAGASKEWLCDFIGPMGGDESNKGWSPDQLPALVRSLNRFFRKKPQYFITRTYIDSGFHPWESPIWIRPRYLVESNKGEMSEKIRQVFGHTMVSSVQEAWKQSMEEWGGRFFMADMLALKHYLVYENGVIKPVKVL
jgi:hypothetical protein